MLNRESFIELFASIDGKDVEKFVSFLAADCGFRFGNLPAVTGIDGISGFSASVASFANIFKTKNLKIVEYLIFADTSQLYR